MSQACRKLSFWSLMEFYLTIFTIMDILFCVRPHIIRFSLIPVANQIFFIYVILKQMLVSDMILLHKSTEYITVDDGRQYFIRYGLFLFKNNINLGSVKLYMTSKHEYFMLLMLKIFNDAS